MPNTIPFLVKLERRQRISEQARRAFAALPVRRRSIAGYRDIVSEGDRTTHCCMVRSCMVSRYKSLRNGERQIVGFHIAGDMVDLQSLLMTVADHGIRTQMQTEVVEFAHGDLLALIRQFPELATAMWFDTLVDASISREWTLNVGRRDARERTAHLLLELAQRMRDAKLIEGFVMTLPVTQSDLADAIGVSPVHMNRSLQWLRSQGYIRTSGKTVTIEKPAEMTEFADFSTMYLHPEGPRPMPVAGASPALA